MPRTIKQIAEDLGNLVTEKNEAYGDAAIVASEILKLVFPRGVEPHQYRDLLLITRVLDKILRIANRKDAFGESPWNDTAGYGILGVRGDEMESLARKCSEELGKEIPPPKPLPDDGEYIPTVWPWPPVKTKLKPPPPPMAPPDRRENRREKRR